MNLPKFTKTYRNFLLLVIVAGILLPACTINTAGGVISSPPRITEPDTALARLSDLVTATAAPDVTVATDGAKPREWMP